VIKRFSEQNYYDEMLFLDADVLVLPGSPNIFDLFTSMAMVDDWYIPNQDERFENWLRNNTGDLGVFDPKAAYFNSGVIGITRETAGKIDYSGPYPNMPWHDQDWLNYKIAKGKIEITQLDRAWNYRELGNPEQAIEDGHFLHFCGDMKKEIANFTQLLR
jgi:lipopolysaccharide biosynthesis glycosyltransferase